MTRLLLIAVAGATGALTRYGLGVAAGPPARGAFPWTTFAINVAGSFLLGVVVVAVPARWSLEVTLALGTGFLGAFTTFSTFSNETTALVRAGHPAMAAAYVVASVAAGLLAAAAGYGLGRAVS